MTCVPGVSYPVAAGFLLTLRCWSTRTLSSHGSTTTSHARSVLLYDHRLISVYSCVVDSPPVLDCCHSVIVYSSASNSGVFSTSCTCTTELPR